MRIITGTARGTKLFTLEGIATRPTLDRIKEPLFSIIQVRIPEANVLDLFAGSGALGMEALSRGASNCVFCDCSNKATGIIYKNLEKTKLQEKSEVYTANYNTCLKKIKDKKMSFDIIFLDPPYASDLIYQASEKIIEYELLNKDGLIIAETDNEKPVLQKLKTLDLNVLDIREYGRVKLLFLNRKG